jgi:hypothetical protein
MNVSISSQPISFRFTWRHGLIVSSPQSWRYYLFINLINLLSCVSRACSSRDCLRSQAKNWSSFIHFMYDVLSRQLPLLPIIELNTRYEVLCSLAILLDKPQPTYTYTDAKYAIRKEGKPAGNAGNAG